MMLHPQPVQMGLSWKMAAAVAISFLVGVLITTCSYERGNNRVEQSNELSQQDAELLASVLAEAVKENPDFFRYDKLVEALMANPEYVAYLREPVTTREEDCVGLILMAVAMEQLPTLPADDVEAMCDWYERRLGSR